jgi:serine/threonine protein kinase
MVKALCFLHEKGVAHRDLKAENIMILKNGLLKILDFGLARENFVSNIYSDSRVGTSSYKAPELFGVAADNQYPSLADYKVDLWSLGVIILYLFSF